MPVNKSYQAIHGKGSQSGTRESQSSKQDNRSSKGSLVSKKNSNSIHSQNKNCYNLMKGVRTTGLTP